MLSDRKCINQNAVVCEADNIIRQSWILSYWANSMGAAEDGRAPTEELPCLRSRVLLFGGEADQ